MDNLVQQIGSINDNDKSRDRLYVNRLIIDFV